MTAYVIVDTKIHNSEEYEEYKALARPLVEKYGGNYLARGGAMQIVDDELWSPTRLVLLEFPDMDTAQAFFDSDEYTPVKAIRHEHADSTSVIFEAE
ncbi:MAG: DUF1330 domain-containing protein [Actinomycetia bacterium]|nr:DUF1330 domain-containing protein [Actinomycetes bacterium]MCP5032488.1 DUF1330 domain-containing protein [Actinomycetes bacterium]